MLQISVVLNLKHLPTAYADQFIKRRDDLIMSISIDEPDVLMIVEVIPKSRKAQLLMLDYILIQKFSYFS